MLALARSVNHLKSKKSNRSNSISKSRNISIKSLRNSKSKKSRSRTRSRTRSNSKSDVKLLHKIREKIKKKLNSTYHDEIYKKLEDHYINLIKELSKGNESKKLEKLEKFLNIIANGIGTTIDVNNDKLNPMEKMKKVKGGASSAIILPNDAEQRRVHPADCITAIERSLNPSSTACDSFPDTCQWPDMYGCQGTPTLQLLRIDTKFDRFGREGGFYAGGFVNDNPASFVSRSMGNPSIKCSAAYTASPSPYNVYNVLLPIEAMSCIAAPWFDKPGGAIQYVFPAEKHIAAIRESLKRLSADHRDLLNAFIKKVTEIVEKGVNYPYGSQRLSAPRPSTQTVLQAPILFSIENLLTCRLIERVSNQPIPPFQ